MIILKQIDYKLFISVIILAAFGCLMIYSSSYVWAEYKFDNPYKYVMNQSVFLVIGIILTYVISKIDYNFYKKKKAGRIWQR